jgi:NhaP-type Na+/H+ or K+/H+ antiporter
MNELEQLQYEARPYFYAVIAAYALFGAGHSKILFFSGILAAFASYYVFKVRREYRSKKRGRSN